MAVAAMGRVGSRKVAVAGCIPFSHIAADVSGLWFRGCCGGGSSSTSEYENGTSWLLPPSLSGHHHRHCHPLQPRAQHSSVAAAGTVKRDTLGCCHLLTTYSTHCHCHHCLFGLEVVVDGVKMRSTCCTAFCLHTHLPICLILPLAAHGKLSLWQVGYVELSYGNLVVMSW